MIVDPSAPGFVAATQVNTLYGATIAPAITTTAHTWVADSTGLFHTATNLQAEWVSLRGRLLAGDTTLTAEQHAEANAEAVFENTKLSTLSAADQARDREDVQREYDAIGAALGKLSIGAHTPFTTETYLAAEHTIQSDTTLEELAIQGHGINNPPEAKYHGYTNDFQNNVDRTTLFVGQGLDNNQNALTDFFDDVIITHLPYVTVTQDGHLEQLNQNGAAEQILQQASGAANDTFFLRAFQNSDFAQTPGTASATPNLALTTPVGLGALNTMTTLFGDTISTTQVVNTGLTAAHTWMADPKTGLFTTTTDLAAEWQADYNVMLAGKASTLTAIQRLEGNAQAVFLNTGLADLTAAQLKTARMDAQRVFDADALAFRVIGYDGKTVLSQTQYIAATNALRGNAAALELFEQGWGVQNPTAARYNGYLHDFANVDTKTLLVYSSGALNNGERAVPEYFGGNILGYLADGITPQGGELKQLNQDGQADGTVQAAVQGLQAASLADVLTATNFDVPGKLPDLATTAPANTVTTLFGQTIGTTITIAATGHVWTADPVTQLYHVNVDLTAEWKADYKIMLAGNASTLTSIQRWEGNAEAAFENTGLARLAAPIQERDREDLQREIDAVVAIAAQIGVDLSKPLSVASYVDIERAIQNNPTLQELGMQGHGLNSPSLLKYNGYTNDFQNNVDRTTNYVGGGTDNGQNALTNFFDDVIMTHLVFQTVAQNGTIIQLNQNGANEDKVTISLTEFNDTLFRRVYVASDFSTNAKAVGEIRFVSAAAATLTDGTNPTPGAGQIGTFYGDVISSTIAANPTAGMAHTWVADANGLFHTTTDLTVEWYNLYQQALKDPSGLNDIQRLEAQAEAVFENTGLKNVGEQQQEADREDAQREFDAIGAALVKSGLGLNASFTDRSYILLEHTLQADHTLLELAMQGHGLNNLNSSNSSAAFIIRYRGYTNDFQNNVDNTTLFLGQGYDAGEKAIADFFDDSIISHTLFPTVAINGELVQLNQNADQENKLAVSVLAENRSTHGAILTAKDFGIEGAQPAAPVSTAPGVVSITTLDGEGIAPTITTLTPHVWVADVNGLFHTTANLEIEWRTDYQIMLAGHGDTLTAIQRLEGNAEALFENTGFTSRYSEAMTGNARETLQRQFDAMAGAMTIDTALGYDPTKPFTVASYIAMEQTIQSNETLYELALQGHGLTNPPSSRYDGFIHSILNGTDAKTLFVGGGFDTNTNAVASFLDRAILTNVVYGTQWIGGQLVQLNQWGTASGTVAQIVGALDDSAYFRTYTAADFSKTASATSTGYVSKGAGYVAADLATSAPAGSIKTLYDQVISNTITIDTGLTAKHVWVADANGLFHTSTDLAAEWRADYKMLLAGGATLSAIQRLEANAEAVFENTDIASIKPSTVEGYREDLQRAFDAMAQAMTTDQSLYKIDPAQPFTADTLLRLEKTLQGNAVDAELWNQGMGLVHPESARYSGYLGDVEAVWGGSAVYKGAGVDTNKDVFRNLVLDTIIPDLGGQVTSSGHGTMVVVDRNGNRSQTTATVAANVNQGAFSGIYKAINIKRWW